MSTSISESKTRREKHTQKPKAYLADELDVLERESHIHTSKPNHQTHPKRHKKQNKAPKPSPYDTLVEYLEPAEKVAKTMIERSKDEKRRSKSQSSNPPPEERDPEIMSPRTTPQSSPTKSQNEKADNDLDVALNKLSTLDPKVSFSPYLQRTNAEQRAKQKAKGFQGTVMIAPILKELSNKEKEKKRKTAHKRKAPPRQKTNPEVDEEDKEKEGSGSANEQETDQTGKSEALEEDWVKVIREEVWNEAFQRINKRIRDLNSKDEQRKQILENEKLRTKNLIKTRNQKINQKADNAEEIRKDLKEKVLDIRRKREQHRHYLEICREEEMLSSILRHNRSPQEQKRLRELRKQRAQLEKEQEDNASEKDDSEGNDPPQNRDGSLDDEYDADRGQRTPTDLDTQPQTQTQDDVDEQLKEPQNEEMESESAKEQENEEQEEVG